MEEESIAVELGLSVTLVHIIELRALEGDEVRWILQSCSDCKDVTRGLEVRKSFGWINVSALPVSSPQVERHTSLRRAPTQAIDQDHPLGP